MANLNIYRARLRHPLASPLEEGFYASPTDHTLVDHRQNESGRKSVMIATLSNLDLLLATFPCYAVNQAMLSGNTAGPPTSEACL